MHQVGRKSRFFFCIFFTKLITFEFRNVVNSLNNNWFIIKLQIFFLIFPVFLANLEFSRPNASHSCVAGTRWRQHASAELPECSCAILFAFKPWFDHSRPGRPKIHICTDLWSILQWECADIVFHGRGIERFFQSKISAKNMKNFFAENTFRRSAERQTTGHKAHLSNCQN